MAGEDQLPERDPVLLRLAEAERAVTALEASQDIASAIGSVDELSRVLEVIVRRGRALIDAQSVLILLREGDELVVAASAGHVENALGRRVPIRGSTAGQVLERAEAQRVADTGAELVVPPTELGVPSARAALLVPMLHRGVAIGVLAAFDRGAYGDSFQLADEQLLRTYAASAANAVTIKRSVETDRLRATIAAAEAERSRWARELHDQTLQTLGGLRVALAAALRRPDPALHEQAIRQAVQDIESETANLRAIIADLRPSLLDDLGLVPALESLVERRREQGLEVEARIELDGREGREIVLAPATQTTIYRLVQESLANVVRHAAASSCTVAVHARNGEIQVTVADDGCGYDPAQRSSGFGIPGMRERVYLAGGELEISSGEGGTRVCARIPVDLTRHGE